MASPVGNRLKDPRRYGRLTWCLILASACSVQDRERQGDEVDERHETPLNANAACYVCHIPFMREDLSTVHLAETIGCIACHGVSAGHANDEEIGATPPDVTFTRNQIDDFCGTCHETHDVPPELVVGRWIERELRPGAAAVCTDCHGSHRIARAGGAGIPPG
jgi:hypothetical protein